jgi:uncharacterized protein YndB with AHSA1/START domain
MAVRKEDEAPKMKKPTTIERTSERELVVTRMFDAPPQLVFQAWTTPALLKRWWAPRSLGMELVTCDADFRTGGKYRFGFDPADPGTAQFFGTFLEVTPFSRLVWTNEEGGADGPVTTVTFEERGGKTLLVLRELYPSKAALDAAGTDSAEGMRETFGQLDELLVDLA